MKTCKKCQNEKELNEFALKGKHRRHVCRECVRGNVVSKVCSKCQIEKNVSEFGKTSDSRDGYRYCCNECRRKERLANRDEINRQRRENCNANIEKVRGKANTYYWKNREVIRNKVKQHRQTNREHFLILGREYRQMNGDKIRKNYREYVKNRREVDLNFKLRGNLRNRVKDVLSRGKYKKSIHTMELLGCTVDFLRNYLESRFVEGMTWDNYGGKNGWQIDHIMPCASFDLSKPENQKKCFHYTNLQPLSADNNRKKHTSVPMNIVMVETIAA